MKLFIESIGSLLLGALLMSPIYAYAMGWI